MARQTGKKKPKWSAVGLNSMDYVTFIVNDSAGETYYVNALFSFVGVFRPQNINKCSTLQYVALFRYLVSSSSALLSFLRYIFLLFSLFLLSFISSTVHMSIFPTETRAVRFLSVSLNCTL